MVIMHISTLRVKVLDFGMLNERIQLSKVVVFLFFCPDLLYRPLASANHSSDQRPVNSLNLGAFFVLYHRMSRLSHIHLPLFRSFLFLHADSNSFHSIRVGIPIMSGWLAVTCLDLLAGSRGSHRDTVAVCDPLLLFPRQEVCEHSKQKLCLFGVCLYTCHRFPQPPPTSSPETLF